MIQSEYCSIKNNRILIIMITFDGYPGPGNLLGRACSFGRCLEASIPASVTRKTSGIILSCFVIK